MSIPHFRDLSLRKKILIYQAFRNGTARVQEKMDGVNIRFKFGFNLDRYGVPKFPPVLLFRSNNSPWVETGEEYLEWAQDFDFSRYFARVIDDLRSDEKFTRSVLGEMLYLDQHVLEAELFSGFVMEKSQGSLKMIRVSYPNTLIKDWEQTKNGHVLFFHDGVHLQAPNDLSWFLPPTSQELNLLFTDASLDELTSRKSENLVRRKMVETLIDQTILDHYHKVNTLSLIHTEGVVITAGDIKTKIVHPDFMTWSLNSNLFKGETSWVD